MHARTIRLILAALAAATLLTIPQAAQAQWRRRRPPRRGGRGAYVAPRFLPRALPEFGVRGGYDFDTNSGSLGADFRLPVGRRGLFALAPSGDLFFNSPGHDWQLNLDGELRAPMVGLYGGGGAALIRHAFGGPLEGPGGPGLPSERETKAGWNLFAGLEPSFAPIRPFVETRWTFQGDHYSAFRLTAGLHVPIGRHFRGRGRA